MDSLRYRVVFSVADSSFHAWPQVAIAVALLAAGLLLMKPRFPEQPLFARLLKTGFLLYFIGFSAVAAYLLIRSTTHDRSQALAALRNGTALVVEGPVHNFKPMPRSGRSLERFCVLEACFEYSDFETSPGFHNTTSHGGPIHEGLPVRITYVGNTILRLEVAE